jgi:hypothetical protein
MVAPHVNKYVNPAAGSCQQNYLTPDVSMPIVSIATDEKYSNKSWARQRTPFYDRQSGVNKASNNRQAWCCQGVLLAVFCACSCATKWRAVRLTVAGI